MLAGIAQVLAAVKLQKVDRLRGVCIGLGPGLPHLVRHPGRQLVAALAHHLSGAKEIRAALLGRHVTPGLEGARSSAHRSRHVFCGSLGKHGYDLRRVRGILRNERRLTRHLAAVDLHSAALPEPRGHALDGRLHGRATLRVREVRERLVAKFAYLHPSILRCRQCPTNRGV